MTIDLPFKDRLKLALENSGISQREFASRTGFGEANVSHYLSGDRKPGADNIQIILRALPDVDARWLLGGYKK
ncbi:helix-turn-helix domain-containing protein [Paraburkholderia sp. 2C]